MSLEKNPTTGLVVEFFGPTLEFLTSPDDERNDFCILKGTIPPGVSVPLHSHPDTEDFLILSGSLDGLKRDGDAYQWIPAGPGDYIHVPAGAPHAWRNSSNEAVVNLVITTRNLARFLQEAGRPIAHAGQPPTPADLARFASIAAHYGHWNATPEENAAVGIHIGFATPDPTTPHA